MLKNINLVKKLEADRSYIRNIKYYKRRGLSQSFVEKNIIPGGDPKFVIECLESTKIKIKNILEIGCADGSKLNKYKIYLKRKKQSVKCYGVDLSSRAVRDGKKKYPNLILKNYSSLQLKKFDTKFDLIICGFFLYLLDREYLFNQFDLIFNKLNTNGHLLIVDFDPLFPHYNQSGHNSKLQSYKMNFKNFLEASNLFKSIYLRKWEISNNFKKKFISSDVSINLFKKIDFEKNFPKNI